LGCNFFFSVGDDTAFKDSAVGAGATETPSPLPAGWAARQVWVGAKGGSGWVLAALLQKPAVGLVAPTPQREEPTKKAAESRPKDGRRPTEEEADVVEAPPGVKRRIQFVALDGVTKALVPRWQPLRNIAVVLWNKARTRTTRNDAVLPTEKERRGEGRV
jgi:hypothetical protein